MGGPPPTLAFQSTRSDVATYPRARRQDTQTRQIDHRAHNRAAAVYVVRAQTGGDRFGMSDPPKCAPFKRYARATARENHLPIAQQHGTVVMS